MKNIYTLLFIGMSFSVFGQGNIIDFAVYPATPTTLDTVYVYVDSWFSSGSCPLDYQSHGVNANTITATSHHCLGLLTVICDELDTFKIDPLPAGTYDFNLTLTTGSLPAPCTPGIVADDQGTVSFTVSQAVGIEENTFNGLKFENPVSGELKFNKPIASAAAIFSVTGQLVKKVEAGKIEVSVTDLRSGLYFIQMDGATRRLMVQ